MPSQFVRVLFPESRTVLVDDAASGQTNQVLILEEGTHRFSLDGEQNYAPSFFEQVIAGTTPAGPLELLFNPAAAHVAVTAAGVATVAAGVAVVAAGVAAGAAAIASHAASAAADAEEETRTDSDTGKPAGKE